MVNIIRFCKIAIIFCILCCAHLTLALRPLKPRFTPPSILLKHIMSFRTIESADTSEQLLTAASGIATLLTVFVAPLAATAAAGIPVGISPSTRVRQIPMDISSTDQIERISRAATSAGPLLPDTSINALDGAVNLGAILFTFVLYEGLFGRAGRPADWVLPVVARAVGEEQSEWYKDFSEGFAFQVPPTVELVRFGIFGVLGWFTNLAWIAALDGDSFWGWSTSACLCFPCGLIALSRDPKQTREEFKFDETMKLDFSIFASKILSKEKASKCSEANIIIRFRRGFAAYRTEEDVSDKVLKRVIRQWIGFKADAEGYYIGVSLLNRKRESRIALAKTMKRLDKEKEDNLLLVAEDEDEDDDYPRFDSEFIRK